MKKRILLFCAILSPCLLYAQGISMGGGTASGANSFSYGTNTTASGEASIAGGVDTQAQNIASVAIGSNTNVFADYGIGLGQFNNVGAEGGVSIGVASSVYSQHAAAIGLNNLITSNAFYSAAIVAGNYVDAWGAVAIGRIDRSKLVKRGF